MSFIVNGLQRLSPVLVYAVVAALVFGETGLFVGFVLPGEAAVIIGGFVASQGHVSIALFCVVVVVAVVLGSTLGYAIGAAGGPRLFKIRLLRPHQARIELAFDHLNRRGGTFVFLGRFLAFFRTVVPGLAGMSEMSFGRFTVANLASAVVWGPGWALVGYFAGNAYARVEHDATWVGLGLVALVVVWVLGRWWWRHRHGARGDAGQSDSVRGDGVPSGVDGKGEHGDAHRDTDDGGPALGAPGPPLP